MPVFVICEGVATYILFSHMQPSGDNQDSDINWDARGSIIANIGLAGFTSMVVGTPLWIIGAKRKSRADLALKKLDIKTDNSMALGLGITIRF